MRIEIMFDTQECKCFARVVTPERSLADQIYLNLTESNSEQSLAIKYRSLNLAVSFS